MSNDASKTKTPVYLVDTSAFVVFDELYPQDSWGVIWDFLLEQAKTGMIVTTEEVMAELERRFYDLKITPWVKLHVKRIAPKKEHFEYLSTEVLVKCDGVMDPDITNTSYADPMLLAIAGHEGFTLVTDEGLVDAQPNTNPLNLKLPNHCKKINVLCIYGRFGWTTLLKKLGLILDKFKTAVTS